MSFDVASSIPLYAGIALTIRVTTPGSPTRVNGGADDAMVDTASDGLFVATIAEDLVGTFTYTIYRSGTPIQTGWFKRIADQASVVLDDPRSFVPDGGTNGTGAPSITVTASRSTDDEAVAGVRVSIVGTAVYDHTNTLGVATLNVSPNATYPVRYTVPAGFEVLADASVVVVTSDVSLAISLIPTTIPSTAPAGLCDVAVEVRNQSDTPIVAAKLSAKISTTDFAIGGVVHLNEEVSAVTNGSGIATIRLIQGATYTFTVESKNGAKVQVTKQVPMETGANFAMLISA